MATSMTNHEIEVELRKVLKIRLNNDLPSDYLDQTSTKDRNPALAEELNNPLYLPPTAVDGGSGNSANNGKIAAFGVGGIYSLTELECRNDALSPSTVSEKDPRNSTKKKKRVRKYKLSESNDQNLEKLNSDDPCVSSEGSLSHEPPTVENLGTDRSLSNNAIYDKIFSEKTIQSLSISVTDLEGSILSTNAKSRRNRKNKLQNPKDQKLANEKLKLDSAISQPTVNFMAPNHSQIDKPNDVQNLSNNITSAPTIAPLFGPLNDNLSNYCKEKISMSSSRVLRDPIKAANALDRLNLSMMDKSPPDLIPLEVIVILEHQHIFLLKKKSSKQPKAKFLCHLCDYHCNNLIICNRHIQSSKHHTSVQKELLATTLRQLPIACDDQLEAIESLLESVFESKCLKDDDIQQRQLIAQKVADFCKDRLPALCEIKLFGSSVSQLGLIGCDANINLFVPTAVGLHPGSILKEVFSVLTEHPEEFSDVTSDYEAKLPAVHFKHHSSGTFCVIGINNTAALQTSELLRDYAFLDRRVKVLCVALRQWAKMCQIDKQSEGTLPPHTFDIMAIYFLQRLSPPVLPVLCDPENLQLNQKSVMANWSTKNWMSVAHLWVEMFRYYALTFPTSGNVITIRKLTPIPTSKKNWRNRIFSVEDPFMISRNLTRNVSSQNMNDFILNCFKLSFKYFGIPQTGAGPLFDYIDYPVNSITGNSTNSENRKLDSAEQVEGSSKSEVDVFKKETVEIEKTSDVVQRENSESMEDDVSFIDFGNDDSSESDLDVNELNLMDKTDDIDGSDTILEVTSEAKSTSEKKLDYSYEVVQNLKEAILEQNNSAGLNSKLDRNSKSKQSENKAKTSRYEQLPTPVEIIELIKMVKKEDFKYRFLWKAFTGGKYPVIECSVCHKQGHLRKDCPEETLPLLRDLPPMTLGFLEAISIACNEIFKMCVPTMVEKETREKLMTELQLYIRKFYPDAVIELFGSSCNGFGFKNSDLDICLTFEGNANGEGINCVEIIMNLAEKLRQVKGFSMVVAIPTAKVPIVKFMHAKAHLECDISLYNTLAKCNTRMLRMYSQIDSRVAVLGFAMKYFAKLCDIGDASRGSLSSYAYTLMILYFLQQRKPPVIPVLQELCEPGCQPGIHMVDDWNAWYFSKLEDLDEVWPHRGKNTETVGELWLNLLKFYTEEFNFKECVICIRQHKILTRFEKLWNSKSIAIEDPFDLNHNLGSGVSNKMSVYIRKTFIKGREVFGWPVTVVPKNFRSVREFLFDQRRLVEGPPPNDRGCRVCGKIGHMVRECPRKKGGNMKEQQKHKGNNKNLADLNDKNRVEVVYKGVPMVAKRQIPINHNQQQQPQQNHKLQQQQNLGNPYLSIRNIEPGRLVAPNFNALGNMLRAPITWHAMPRPFIQPNLNQRVSLPYVGTNSAINRIPGPFPPPRPQLVQPSNIRIIRPLGVQQGHVFVDQRHTNDKSSVKP